MTAICVQSVPLNHMDAYERTPKIHVIWKERNGRVFENRHNSCTATMSVGFRLGASSFSNHPDFVFLINVFCIFS